MKMDRLFGKRLTALALCCAMALTAAGCGSYKTEEKDPDREDRTELKPNKPKPTDPEPTDPEPTAPESTGPVPTEPVEIAVSDAYSDAFWTDQLMSCVVCYHIPQVERGGDTDLPVNDLIYDELYGVLSEEVYAGQWDEYYYPRISDMAYTWSRKDDVVSIVVKTESTDFEWTQYYVYNCSAGTGEAVSSEALLTLYGLTPDACTELVRSRLEAEYTQMYSDPYESSSDNTGFIEFYNEQLQNTISDENIAAVQPYIGANGDLCCVANIYSMAGADSYLHQVNLTGTGEPAQIECTLDHTDAAEPAPAPTHEINISEDEAYQIACDYWDYTEGQTSGESGFELFLVSDGLIEQTDGTNYYAFRLQWLVKDEIGGHMSTIDFLYINAETGECAYTI